MVGKYENDLSRLEEIYSFVGPKTCQKIQNNAKYWRTIGQNWKLEKTLQKWERNFQKITLNRKNRFFFCFSLNNQFLSDLHRLIEKWTSDSFAARKKVQNFFDRNLMWIYILIFFADPDVPSRANPTMQFKHWLVINIPGSDIINGKLGTACSPYFPPTPPAGSGE